MLIFVEFVEFRVGGCAGVFFCFFLRVCLFFLAAQQKTHTHTRTHEKTTAKSAPSREAGLRGYFRGESGGKAGKSPGYLLVCVHVPRPPAETPHTNQGAL